MDAVPAAEAAYLAAVVARLRGILGGELIGVYPTGSLALAGYLPGRSDLDLIVVVPDGTGHSLLAEVAAGLDHTVLPCPAAGLELVVQPRSVVASGEVRPGYLLDLNTGRELPPKVSYAPGAGADFWYAIDRSITCQAGTALTGPPVTELFRPVPYDLLRPVVVESVRAHRDDADRHGGNAVLNGARALRYARQRRWYAKAAAARWAARLVPDFAELLEAAVAGHAAGRAAGRQLPADRVRAFLTEVLRRTG